MSAPHGHPLTPCGSQRLRLREFQAGDAAAVAALHALPAVQAQLVEAHALHDPTVAALLVQRLCLFYPLHPGLGIWHASDEQGFVGWFSLMPMQARPGAVELGSRLHPRAWGQGLALDGGEALLAHAFGPLGLAEVWGACAPANAGARLCLGALGFELAHEAAYDGQPALYHRLGRGRWAGFGQQPRRQRLRAGAVLARAPLCEEMTA